jgi:hypothetical protein
MSSEILAHEREIASHYVTSPPLTTIVLGRARL